MKTMNAKVWLCLLVAAMTANVAAQDDVPATLEIVPFSITAGEEKEIELELNNPSYTVCGCQCDIYLPNGLSFVLDEYDDPMIEGNRSTKITTEGAIQDDGALKLLTYSGKNYTYTGTEGSIVTITVKADNQLADGIYELTLKNIIISKYVDKTVTKVEPEDYPVSVIVGAPNESAVTIQGNVTADVIQTINSIFGSNVNITSLDISNAVAVDGESTITLGNPNALVFLPEGATIANTTNVIEGETCNNLVLTDKCAFAAPKAFTASKVSYTRESGNNWGTICVPFELASDEKIQYFTLDASGVDLTNGTLTFTEASSVSAGTPAVFCRADGGSMNLSATDVSIAAGDAGYADGGLKLVGTYAPISITGDNYYIAKDAFWLADSKSVSVPAFRAYFEGTATGVKSFNINTDESTGVKSVTLEVDKQVIYDLMGRQLKNTEKGINIVNGKKVLVK